MTPGGAPPSGGGSGCGLMSHRTKLGRAERAGDPAASFHPASSGECRLCPLSPLHSWEGTAQRGPSGQGSWGAGRACLSRASSAAAGLRGGRWARPGRGALGFCVRGQQTCAGSHLVAGAVLDVGGRSSGRGPRAFSQRASLSLGLGCAQGALGPRLWNSRRVLADLRQVKNCVGTVGPVARLRGRTPGRVLWVGRARVREDRVAAWTSLRRVHAPSELPVWSGRRAVTGEIAA